MDKAVEYNLAKSFAEEFKLLTPRQFWALFEFGRHSAFRCRHPQALLNSMSRMFPYANFEHDGDVLKVTIKPEFLPQLKEQLLEQGSGSSPINAHDPPIDDGSHLEWLG
jgi:hypothetical protein